MLPGSVSYIFDDPSILGESNLVREEDEKFDENLRRGRIAAETLKKPMTFFEAVEALDLPAAEAAGGDKKKGQMASMDKKGIDPKFLPHHFVTNIDLSGLKGLRFSKVGL